MLNFLDLYDLYAKEVFRFALWLSGDRFEAEDITSETLETLKAYLFTIARNIYLKKRRNINKQVAIDDSYPDPHPNPEQLIDSRLELLRIQNTIQKLPEVDRTAFALRVQHDLPYAEIARILEISLTAAKVKVHRVRKKLLATSDDKEIG
jgi:RNA polymerase sigma-70 factor (ECF subfamily)